MICYPLNTRIQNNSFVQIQQIEAILGKEHLHQFFYKSCPAHGGRRNIMTDSLAHTNKNIFKVSKKEDYVTRMHMTIAELIRILKINKQKRHTLFLGGGSSLS